jgi:hypothetical protein
VVVDAQGYESNVAIVSVTVDKPAKRGGGGALEAWSILALGLLAFAKLAPRKRRSAFQR